MMLLKNTLWHEIYAGQEWQNRWVLPAGLRQQAGVSVGAAAVILPSFLCAFLATEKGKKKIKVKTSSPI
jgi:hypothetical protein